MRPAYGRFPGRDRTTSIGSRATCASSHWANDELTGRVTAINIATATDYLPFLSSTDGAGCDLV